MKLSREGWAGLVALATSLFLFYLTLDLKGNPLVPIGPGFYPRIVLGLSAGLALLLLVFDLRKPKAPEKSDANLAMVLAVFVVSGIYVVLIPALGFRIATLLFMLGLQVLLEPPKGPRGWARVGIVAVVTAVATYFLFERYLQVLLPRGRWTDF